MDTPTILISFLSSASFSGFLIFWFNERLKQSIKHEYDLKLEIHKKELELNFNKQKTLYEGKLTQYKKYYSLFDKYSQNSRTKQFTAFQNGMLGLIEDPSDENVQKYVEGILSLQMDLSDQFLMFKMEINALRLEAGEPLLH